MVNPMSECAYWEECIPRRFTMDRRSPHPVFLVVKVQRRAVCGEQDLERRGVRDHQVAPPQGHILQMELHGALAMQGILQKGLLSHVQQKEKRNNN